MKNPQESILTSYTLIKSEKITEINTLADLYIHKKSGLTVLSLQNDDENKAFLTAFKTPPANNKGIPHILEHSVLCGSDKYPLKEPFVELLKGSMNTFLNAFTYPDKTVYPLASTNTKDFYNLIDVYLDAIFHPKLTKETLAQEGWHYELDNVKDPLKIKGVVYNEMKGSYSSPERILWDELQRSLLPDTPYAYDSGGKPSDIPLLTYEEFIAFHKVFYVPSNALVVFYGDDDPLQRLVILDEYCKTLPAAKNIVTFPIQKERKTTDRVTTVYPITASDNPLKKNIIALGWLFPIITDLTTILSLHILEYVLVGSSAAILRKALIDSGLGEDLTGSGIEMDLQQYLFAIGLKGTKLADHDRIEQLILKTLSDAVKKGIDPKLIEAALNTIEFHLREQNTGSFPRGLAVGLGAVNFWQYGLDPVNGLRFEEPLSQLKRQLKDGERTIEHLIERLLLHNNHVSVITVKADPTLESKLEQREQDSLETKKQSYSKPQLAKLSTQSLLLKKLQETPDSEEALQTLPTLTRKDLDTEVKKVPNQTMAFDDATILTHDLPTHGIHYLDFAFPLTDIEPELLPYIPLFARSLSELGTTREDFSEFSNRIDSKSGGIWTLTVTDTNIKDKKTYSYLVLRTKFLSHQTQDVFSILQTMVSDIRFDNKNRFQQILLENKSSFEASVVENGHEFARQRLLSQLSQSEAITEQYYGISQLFFLRLLQGTVKDDWASVLEKLTALSKQIFSSSGMVINITTKKKDLKQILPFIHAFVQDLPKTSKESRKQSSQIASTPVHNEVLTVPTTVNYVAKGVNLFDHGYVFDGSHAVVSRYLRSTWLWEQVRVKGGAYGAFEFLDYLEGTFVFSSYRDPHITKTLEAFDHSVEFLKKLTISKEQITRAVIGSISDMDRYQLPDAKGFSSLVRYLSGVSDEMRQKIRGQILSTTEQDFHDFRKVLDIVKQHGTVVITTNDTSVKSISLPFEKTKVL